jgi:sialic acid synthase SpsE
MQKRSIRAGSIDIGCNHPPFIVAEMSCNHNKSLERALEVVEAAGGHKPSNCKPALRMPMRQLCW